MGAVAIDKTGNPCPMKPSNWRWKVMPYYLAPSDIQNMINDPTAKVRPEQGLAETQKIIAAVCKHPAGQHLSLPASFVAIKNKKY